MPFFMDEIFCNQCFCAENHENKLTAAKKLSVIAVLQGRECSEKELLYRNRQLEPKTSRDLWGSLWTPVHKLPQRSNFPPHKKIEVVCRATSFSNAFAIIMLTRKDIF